MSSMLLPWLIALAAVYVAVAGVIFLVGLGLCVVGLHSLLTGRRKAGPPPPPPPKPEAIAGHWGY